MPGRSCMAAWLGVTSYTCTVAALFLCWSAALRASRPAVADAALRRLGYLRGGYRQRGQFAGVLI